MRGNTIQIELPLKRGKVSKTIPLYQYDYGQNLVITGAELPEAYEVHFANEMHGDAVTSIGGSTGVAIPDSVLTSGDPIYLWLYLHEDSTDGETEFQGVIPVIKRASISDQTPTPAEQSAITEAIAALNSAVTQTTAAKNAAVAAQTHIENLSVSATTATPEAGASVTKTVNAQGEVNLAFAIPRGDKGDKGDQGIQGEPGTSGTNGTNGVSPVVSLTKADGVTTFSVTDAVDTYTVEINDGEPGDPTDLIDDDAGSGNTDVTWSANKLANLTTTVGGKADLVSSPTEGNFAALTSGGNLTDSGHKHSDYLTSHQDITGKADKVSSPTNGDFAALDSNGNLTDSGHKHSDYLTTGTIDDTAGDGDTDKVWSADKSADTASSLLTEINSAESDIEDLQDSLIKTISWNLAKRDGAVIDKGHYYNNTQTVGQAVTRSSDNKFYTIKVPVEEGKYVYFLCEKYATQYGATGYNNKYASRFMIFVDGNENYVEGYSYPAPYVNNGTPTRYQVPTGAKYIYVSCTTTDGLAIAADESNMGYYWVTYAAENAHVDTYESKLDDIEDDIETLASSVSDLTKKAEEFPAVQSIRKPTFAFIFDDGTDGDVNAKALFDSYGFKCGFALIDNSALPGKVERYLGYQNEGFEILSHSVNGDAWDSISSSDAMDYAENSYNDLTEAGFNVTGWVTPSTWTNADGLNAIKKFYQYGWGHYSGEASTDALHTFGEKDVRQLERWSLQSNTVEDTLAKITATVSANGLLCFYGHSYPQTGDNMTEANMTTILDAISALVAAGNAQVLIPRKAINDYFAFRYSDYLYLAGLI